MFQIGVAPRRIVLLTTITGVSFGDARKNALVVGTEGLDVSVPGREELLRNKRDVGRTRFLADLEELGEVEPEGGRPDGRSGRLLPLRSHASRTARTRRSVGRKPPHTSGVRKPPPRSARTASRSSGASPSPDLPHDGLVLPDPGQDRLQPLDRLQDEHRVDDAGRWRARPSSSGRRALGCSRGRA